MKLFNKVAIIGTGLIGGSIALAIRKKGLARQIIGVSRHKDTLALAKKRRIIDEGSQDLSIVRGADLVVFATPIKTIIQLSDEVAKYVDEDCVVTDVGSTKKEIVAELNRIFPNYVGSHPLAGSEKRGVANVQADIFKGSLCILTPVKNTSPAALKKARSLWVQLGARIAYLTPETHDKVLSFVSHLPHAVAFSLISSVPDEFLKFAASGLRDTTRIASSDSRLWVDIFLSNRENALKAIESFQKSLSAVKTAISRRDENRLIAILKEAKEKREALK